MWGFLRSATPIVMAGNGDVSGLFSHVGVPTKIGYVM